MKEDGKTSQRKNTRRKIGSDGKIAGQGMKKDSVTTLLFQANNENFAELFNRTLLADPPATFASLDINRGIPIGIKENDSIGSHEIDSESSHTGRE